MGWIHKVLLGAILIKPDLAPYSLPDLEIEHFPVDLQPVFAALSGLWNAKGQLDAVEACARYPEQRTAIMECVEEAKTLATMLDTSVDALFFENLGNQKANTVDAINERLKKAAPDKVQLVWIFASGIIKA